MTEYLGRSVLRLSMPVSPNPSTPQMSMLNKPGFPAKFFTHLNVKYHFDLLMPRWDLVGSLLPNFEDRANIFSFFEDRIPPPEGVAIIGIKCTSLGSCLWYLHTKLVGADPIFRFYFLHNHLWFLFFNVYGTHQAKLGSSAIWGWSGGYSATCTGATGFFHIP